MKRNYSYTYLLPLVAENVYFDKRLLAVVDNTYIFNKNSNYPNNCFIVVCKIDYDDKEIISLEHRMIKSSLYIGCHQLKDTTVYIFEFPKAYHNERVKFINGKYSEFKISTKRKILTYWTKLYGTIPSFVTGSLMNIKQILFKEERLRKKMTTDLKVEISKEAELGYLIDEDKETFNFEGIIKQNLLKENNI